jgi:hypothetical protein
MLEREERHEEQRGRLRERELEGGAYQRTPLLVMLPGMGREQKGPGGALQQL